jgi:hypothetical protein
MHYFPGMNMQNILWDYSYANIVMLLSSVPKYDAKKDKKKKAKELEIKDISELEGLI